MTNRPKSALKGEKGDCKEPTAKLKGFEEYRRYLDRCKAEFDEAYNKKRSHDIGLADFELGVTLGVGSFGHVILVKYKHTNKYYAMKIMKKEKLVREKQVEHSLNEKKILCSIKFPFVINMEYHFKDNCNIFFVMPFVNGGDLFTYLRRQKNFKEKDAKFYAAQVLLAFEYLHHLNLMYRDLKPENIVIDNLGYIKLTDFGFAKLVTLRTYTLCGTPEYLAPEMILNKGYGKSVDWWSFGILVYEMLAGYTPFYADEVMKIYEKIVSGRFKFTSEFSSDAKDLIRNIVQVDTTKRFGNLKNGVMDIKGHVWFKSTDWQAIHNRKAISPYVPPVRRQSDTSCFDHFGDLRIAASATVKYELDFKDF